MNTIINIFKKVLFLKTCSFKYSLLLSVINIFLHFPCFGMMNFDQEDRIIDRKKYTYKKLNKQNNIECYDKNVIIESYNDEEFCCFNLFYYSQVVWESFSKNNQGRLHESIKSSFEILPNDIINSIITYLNPTSLVRLSHVSWRFRSIFNNDFWINYNKIHQYQEFNEYASIFLYYYTIKSDPIKITLANYYYEMGNIKKAFFLGLKLDKCKFCETYVRSKNSGFSSNYVEHVCDQNRITELENKRAAERRELQRARRETDVSYCSFEWDEAWQNQW